MFIPKPFEVAKKESFKSDHHSHRLGACVLNKKEVVSRGHNLLTKTHPMIRRYDSFKTLHAEMHAILRCPDKSKLVGATMVIYRESRDGNPALARPCPVCVRMMKDAGIKKMAYTTKGGWEEEAL